jgi:hypothetical protein
MYYEKARPDRRRARRWNVIWPAKLFVDEQEYSCTILDLSEYGARIESHARLSGPSLAKLASDRFGCLEGRVRWTRGRGAGLRFEAPPEDVLQLLKRVVPGLGRREQADADPPSPPLPRPAPKSRRRLFGRRFGAKLAS